MGLLKKSNNKKKKVRKSSADDKKKSYCGKSTHFVMKAIMLGPCAVGKTTFGKMFVDNTPFDEIHPAMTLGADFFIKEIIYNDLCVKLALWDTGGAWRFLELIKHYVKWTHFFIFFVNLTELYFSIKVLVERYFPIVETTTQKIGPEFKDNSLVIGTFLDEIPNSERDFVCDEFFSFLKSYDLDGICVSLKTGENYKVAVDTFISKIYFFAKNNLR